MCGECGETIFRPAGASTLPWLHVASGVSRCYRDPHTETAWPDADFAVDFAEPQILGFLAQCDCGQQALVATQPSGDWVCPRCAANMRGGFGDVDVAAAEPEDEWPVCKVRG